MKTKQYTLRLLGITALLLSGFLAVGQDYPGAVWNPADANNYGVASRTATDIRWIVIHTTEDAPGSDCSVSQNWFKNPSSGVSAHYVICRDGTVVQMVRNKDIAYHAGNYSYNQQAIGIEHERHDTSNWTEVQFQASVQLVKWLLSHYSIQGVFPAGIAPANPSNGSGIIGHNQVPDPNNPALGGGLNHKTDPVNWDWAHYQALFASSGTVAITVDTAPTGLSITVDNIGYTAPQTFNWSVGNSHTLSTPAPQFSTDGKTRYPFAAWSDAGAQTHTISVPSSAMAYRAFFNQEFLLTMNAGSGGSVSPGDGWHAPDTVVNINATAYSGYSFSSWTGTGSGSYSGTSSSTSVTMRGPITETANFSGTTHTLTVASSNPGSGVSITVSPNDNAGNGNGTTQLTRTYNQNTVVSLAAPASVSGNSFQKWQRNGVDWSSSASTSITIDADYTFTAVYGASGGIATLATGVGSPTGIAVDGTSVYWSEYGGTVKKVPKTGGAVTTLASGLYSPSGLALDSSYVYFAENVGNPASNIKKVPKSGGSVTILASGLPGTSKVAVDGTSVYWTDGNGGTVRKVPISGGAVSTLATGYTFASGIAVDGSSVYWTEFNNPGPVRKVGLNGGTVTQLGDSSNTPGIATDGNNVYWTENVFSGNGKIRKVPVNGGTVVNIATGLTYPWDLALDANTAYWVEYRSSGAVRQAALAGGAVSTLASGLNYPVVIGIDNSTVYWGESGAIKSVAKSAAVPDTSAPSITITVPTTNPTYTTGSGSLDLGGTASDNVGVTQVAWSNDRGGSGTANGTTYWSVYGINLQNGQNTITVTAYDSAGNTGTDILIVTYTANNLPDTPSNGSPVNGATGISLSPALQASAYSDADGDAHAASQWKVYESAGTTLVWDSNEDTVNKTSCAVPSGVLAYSTTYRWQVRYKDSRGAWSSYSALTGFTVMPMPSRIIALSGNLAFGNVTVNSTALATLTIANTGNSTLMVSGISYPAGFSGAWSGTIPTGYSQPVTVTFAPASVTSYGNNLTVNSDATGGINTFAVSGTGVPAPAVVALNQSTLNQVYDGSPRVVTSSTTPPGLALTITYDGSTTPPTGAGPYTVVATVNDPNYTGSASGTLAVTPAPLTVTANNASRTYGGANPAFSATITGFVNGETVAVVSGAASLTTAATATSPVGPNPIVPAVGTLSAANYTFANFVNGTLTVTPAALTIRANDHSKTYGQSLIFAGTESIPSGLVGSDTVTGVTLTSAGAGSTATVAGSPYSIAASGATGEGLGNYTISYQPGTLTVGPAALTITANNRSKTYGEAVSFAGTEFTPSGLQNSETVGSVTLASSGAAATAAVSGSPFSIVPSAATGGTLNPANYTITYQNGALTVNPVALTVTANNTNRVYGAANPVFTGTIVGLQNNDNITAVFTCSAGVSSPVGIYSIVPSLVDSSGKVGNYSTTLSNGRLAITAPEPRITGGRLDQAFGVSVNSTAVGANYVLEFKNSLADPFWLPVQSLPGNGGAITFTNDTGGAPARFYRIRVE